MAYVFYDTETTGTNTTFDQMLPFAAILAQKPRPRKNSVVMSKLYSSRFARRVERFGSKLAHLPTSRPKLDGLMVFLLAF